jgi:type IV pilus assembly protein PilB
MNPLLEALIKKNVLNRYQAASLSEAIARGTNLFDALAQAGISGAAIRSAQSAISGVPERIVQKGTVSYDVLRTIPEDAVTTYHMVPLAITGKTLSIGMLDPNNFEARQAVQFLGAQRGLTPELFVISREDYQSILESYRGVQTGSVATESQFDQDATTIDDEPTKHAEPQVVGEPIIEDAPATKTVAVILKNAIEGGASDIHIENTGEEVKVRYRVDGILHTSLRTDKSMHQSLVARIKVLAKMKLDERRKPQDNRFAAIVDGRKVDFRVSVLPTFFGEKVVIRILDPEKGVRSLEDLGMTPEHMGMIRDALARPYGLILLTGPTGSGKTTTLYAMLQEVDRERLNVVSLEQPIEYHIPGVSQSQVRPEIGYTFAAGLRSILRQDPDVIMVGEIRDKETAELAIQAALTGHLVFATLHTNSAIGVVPRLVDMGIDPYLIAPTLVLSVAQRLVRRADAAYTNQQPIDEARRAFINDEIKDLPMDKHAQFDSGTTTTEITGRPAGEGTKGRLGAFEMFPMNRELERIILKDPTEPTIYDYVRAHGMITMREDAILKSMKGDVPWSEVMGL